MRYLLLSIPPKMELPAKPRTALRSRSYRHWKGVFSGQQVLENVRIEGISEKNGSRCPMLFIVLFSCFSDALQLTRNMKQESSIEPFANHLGATIRAYRLILCTHGKSPHTTSNTHRTQHTVCLYFGVK